MGERDYSIQATGKSTEINSIRARTVDLPDGINIAHRMGTLQQEFPMLCRTGITAADPLENIGSFRNESHVDFIYLASFHDRWIEQSEIGQKVALL